MARYRSLIRAGLALWLVSLSAQAAIDTYEFKDEKNRERFQQLTAELRCPKCQNQNIADSNAPIAADLRAKIYQMLKQDRSDQEILDYMIARYGDFVLYQPRMDRQTWVLWFGPGVLLLLGVAVVIIIARRSRGNAKLDEPHSDELSEKQKKQLELLLQEKDKKTL